MCGNIGTIAGCRRGRVESVLTGNVELSSGVKIPCKDAGAIRCRSGVDSIFLGNFDIVFGSWMDSDDRDGSSGAGEYSDCRDDAENATHDDCLFALLKYSIDKMLKRMTSVWNE